MQFLPIRLLRSALFIVPLITLLGLSAVEGQLHISTEIRQVAAGEHDQKWLGKLAPELRAALKAKAAYVGHTMEGRSVLRFAPDVPAQVAHARLATVAGVIDIRETVGDFMSIDTLIVNYAGDNAPVETIAGLEIVDTYERGKFVVVTVQGEGFTHDQIAALAKSETVKYVEPNHQYELQRDPNDPLFSRLWGMQNIRAPSAWDQTNTSPSVVVAVVDTGIDYEHEDLRSNIWINASEQNGRPNVDDDGNGYVDDIYGYDFYSNDGDPRDGHSHGTHCAGTIGAAGDNSTGVVGVTWRVRIMAVQIFSSSGGFAGAAQAVKAIDYATDNGANIQSNSWGGGAFNQNIRNAIGRAEAQGVLFVAAAGNSSSNNDRNPHYPSSYSNDNIMAVLSIDRSDNLSSFSSYGAVSVDIGAPGSSIYSTIPSNAYGYKSGTSMATPHVSGAAALVWPTVSGTPVQRMHRVKKKLLDNARSLSALSRKCLTGGTLNIDFVGDGTTPTTLAAAQFTGAVYDLDFIENLHWCQVLMRDRGRSFIGITQNQRIQSILETGFSVPSQSVTVEYKESPDQPIVSAILKVGQPTEPNRVSMVGFDERRGRCTAEVTDGRGKVVAVYTDDFRMQSLLTTAIQSEVPVEIVHDRGRLARVKLNRSR